MWLGFLGGEKVSISKRIRELLDVRDGDYVKLPLLSR